MKNSEYRLVRVAAPRVLEQLLEIWVHARPPLPVIGVYIGPRGIPLFHAFYGGPTDETCN